MFFLNSASSAAALVFYLPGVCTLTPRENRGRQESGNILISSEKTQYLINTLYIVTAIAMLVISNLHDNPVGVGLEGLAWALTDTELQSKWPIFTIYCIFF